jgi:hypothetical protein
VGDHTIKMSEPQIYSSNGVTLVSQMTPADLRQIYLVKDGHLVALQKAETDPVMSSDGRYAAWETFVPGRLARIVLWDLAADRELGSREFRSHAQCCTAPSLPVGIDGHSQVYIWDGGHAVVWNWQDGTIFPITGIRGDGLSDAYAQGPVYEESSTADDGGDGGWSVYGMVGPTGREEAHFTAVDRIPGQQAVWSPPVGGGQSVAYVAPNGRPVALNTDTRARTPLHLPPGRYVAWVWESPTTVLLSSDADGNTYWLRCDATTGDCEIAQVFHGAGPDGVEVPQDG